MSLCLKESFSFLFEYNLSLGNGALSFETEFKIFLHLSYRHPTALEAAQTLYPFDIVIAEDAIVVSVSFDIRYQPFVTVKLQVLIAHISHGTRLFHRVHKNSPKKFAQAIAR